MKKIYPVLLTLALLSTLSADQSSQWQQFQAAQAMDDLDAEFEDKPAAAPKVIVKEKVVYRDRPVEVEKVVYKDRVVEKVVYRDRPVAVAATTKKAEPAHVDGRKYDVLFVDIGVSNDPTFISDYVHLTERSGGLDWRKMEKAMLSAPDKGSFSITVAGKIELPDSINSDRIYIKPIAGPVNKMLTIDDQVWDAEELNIINAYKQTRVIPFRFTFKQSGYYSSKTKFIETIKKYIPTVRFLVSNKPTARGEKKAFVPARIFIIE